VKAILSVDSNWGIGFENRLLQRIPEDMKFFKQMTLGKVVVMGRGTFESLPGKQPLKGRVNIILSKEAQYNVDSLIICRSLNELLQELSKYPAGDVFIIGGESIFAQLLPYCSEVYITRFHKSYEADRFFFNMDDEKDWKCEIIDESLTYDGLKYSRVKYFNNNPKQLS
jgi:dihydrofolate reductase